MEKNAQRLYEALTKRANALYTDEALNERYKEADPRGYLKYLEEDTRNRTLADSTNKDDLTLRNHTRYTDAGAKYDPKRHFYNAWIESGVPGAVNYGWNRMLSPFSSKARENVAYARGAHSAVSDVFRHRGIDQSSLGLMRTIRPVVANPATTATTATPATTPTPKQTFVHKNPLNRYTTPQTPKSTRPVTPVVHNNQNGIKAPGSAYMQDPTKLTKQV